MLQKTELKNIYKCPMCNNVEEIVEEKEKK